MCCSNAASLVALLCSVAVVVSTITHDGCVVNSDGAMQCEALAGAQLVQRGKLAQPAEFRTPFFDVDTCAAQGPEHGRFALAVSYAGVFPEDLLPHVLKMRAYGGWADVIILTTAQDAKRLSKEQQTALSINKVQLMLTDQIMPPELTDQCDLQDLVGLHVLALEGYDGVALYSHDAEPRGDIRPILKCAAAGHLITANPGIDERSTGIDFVAARPDPRLFSVALGIASRLANGKNCGMDLLESLVGTSSNPAVQLALAEAGSTQAVGIDPCIWNYRAGVFCGEHFDISRVRVQRGVASGDVLQLRSPLSLLAREPTFGFWFPVFNQASSVLRVVGSVRKHYPDSPILLVGDGGVVNFAPVCERPKYKCAFEQMTPENSRWNPHSWFKRMREGTQKLGTDYVIYLEPDVEVRHRHKIHPEHDAGGVFDNFNPSFGQPAIDYLERKGRERNPDFRILWTHFGLTGGSYFRSEAILDAFALEHINKLDYVGLEANMHEPAWSSDLAMHLALSARGWEVYPWKECAQNFLDAPKDEAGKRKFAALWPALNEGAAFEHNHKEHYNDHLDKEDEKLLAGIPYGPPDVTCHGCVWYDWDNHLLPIPSGAPLPLNEQDRFDWVPPSLTQP
eukprot:CAMPEP_0172680470 /NCGR_PEP_ID=MMETSP1074-20121228/16784_1 /TAXON_ID=2916 /ORGANISM="Ceratium fusus, Strain PA161109" /LENGTH=622 /DNA_ID=CAMNT_0013498801 /DNA_START=46 /DNA_END=1914 /DNA_ORIENTATION=-